MEGELALGENEAQEPKAKPAGTLLFVLFLVLRETNMEWLWSDP